VEAAKEYSEHTQKTMQPAISAYATGRKPDFYRMREDRRWAVWIRTIPTCFIRNLILGSNASEFMPLT